MIGSRDDSHLTILENAQELRLRGKRHISDLMHKQRASMCVLEQSRLVVRGVRECAFHVANQFALEQRFDDSRAVLPMDLPQSAQRSRACVRIWR